MTKQKYNGRLLIVDDDINTCKFWQTALTEQGFRVEFCNNLSSMHDIIKSYFIDAILLDLELGDENGLDALPLLVSESPYSKVFILTAHASVDTAIDSLRNGATDYITKDTSPEEIADKIKDALTQSENNTDKLEASTLIDLGFIGKGKSFNQLNATIEQVKDVDSTVLILGESGTGKEVVARAIHKTSKRSKMRFEAINCAAIPEALLESELFGHKKGAFTDAKSDRKGIFELCSGGTLLLDEIGDMPLALQSKMLRVLQERVIVPVGSSQSIKVDTRVLAATHRNLKEEIELGHFREDLYFRLSVVPIQIPPLRHRKDDIQFLIEYFLKDFNQRFEKNIAPPGIDVMRRLMAYDWPGNVRELRNAIERGVVLSTDNSLHVENLLQHLQGTQQKNQSNDAHSHQNAESVVDGAIFNLGLTDAKQAFEKIYVEKLLAETKGNIAEVGRRCGRYRADLYRLFEKYGIDHDSYR